jgi:hypothetical protein
MGLVEFMVLMCWVLRDHPGSLRMGLAVQLPEGIYRSLVNPESPRVIPGFPWQFLQFPRSLIRLPMIQPVLGAHDPQSMVKCHGIADGHALSNQVIGAGFNDNPGLVRIFVPLGLFRRGLPGTWLLVQEHRQPDQELQRRCTWTRRQFFLGHWLSGLEDELVIWCQGFDRSHELLVIIHDRIVARRVGQIRSKDKKSPGDVWRAKAMSPAA